jgi:hypothetical protein
VAVVRLVTDIFAGLGMLWSLIGITVVILLLVTARDEIPEIHRPPCAGRPPFRIRPNRPYDWENDR